MRVAFISTIPLFPTTGGNRARQLTLIREIQAQGHEVDFIFMPSRQQGEFEREAHLEFFGAEHFYELERQGMPALFYLLKRAGCAAIRAVARALRIRKSKAHFLDEIYYRPFSPQISDLYKVKNFDVAIVTYIWFSEALKSLPDRVFKVIDTHDSFSHQTGDRVEAVALKRADAVVAIQEEEATRFRRQIDGGKQQVFTISHIVPPTERVVPVENVGATFIGSSFDANKQSLRYFVDEVLPLILCVRPRFKLLVGGTICRDIDDHPSVEKLNFIPALDVAFRRAPISINPIVAGTGVKIKLLESIAYGIPVVSTQKGLEGLDASQLPGVVVVADRQPSEFAAAVISLYDSQERQHASRAAALRAAESWNNRQRLALSRLLLSAKTGQREGHHLAAE